MPSNFSEVENSTEGSQEMPAFSNGLLGFVRLNFGIEDKTLEGEVGKLTGYLWGIKGLPMRLYSCQE